MCVLRLICAFVTVAAALAPAATLEQMSLDEMIRRSTYIVRGQAGGTRTIQAGGLIYTLRRFQVRDQWKGEPQDQVEIALPGGKLGNLSQRFGGVPPLTEGGEFVVFLWKGPSGRTQIMGLSQGLFEVERRGSSEVLALRKPNADLVLEPGSGNSVQSAAIEMPLADLVERITLTLGSGRQSEP